MSRIFASAIAIGFGLVTLFGLIAGTGPFSDITKIILQITVITAAIALLIGIINMLNVHLRRVFRRERGFIYSLVMIISLLAVVILWLIDRDSSNRILLEHVQVSIESALAGLVLFALVFGAYRLLSRRVTWGGVLFIVSLLTILLGALPLTEAAPLAEIRAWLLAVPVSAGARGILLGIALATIVAGVRVLIGQDRAYHE